MPSLFPGMDPYLENPGYWSDFHSRFVNVWCESIADALPPEYEASLGERVYLVEHDPDARKQGEPDVAVSRAKENGPPRRTASATVATLDPVTVPLQILDGPRESYVEILHQPDRSLISVLELLSPANKELPGRGQYLAKRRALLYQNVHLIELDLLRGGQRLPMGEPIPPGDCYYYLSRAEQHPDCDVYHWTYREPMPSLPVPLRSPDPDIIVDLAAVFTTAFDRGRFGKRLRYDGPNPGHLTEDENAWAQTILSAK